MKPYSLLILLLLCSQLITFAQESEETDKPLEFTFSLGFDLGNILEINSPTGEDKNSFTLKTSLDLGLNYSSDSSRFASTNELHYSLGIQKSGINSGTHVQNVLDDLVSLHDVSLSFARRRKLNFNVILKASSSVFSIYEGDYFTDFDQTGMIQGFANPYDIEISPGFKYQPNENVRLSLSPYSFQIYGIKSNELAAKGIYIDEMNEEGNYKQFIFKRIGGASVNFWYDKKVKKWLTMQYRIGLSTDYFENFGRNCQLNGLLITKIKIIKDLFLNHKATIKGDLHQNILKPYYNQTLMLNYSKTF